ncbi:multidrug ABC transporter ATP-binding protein [Nocardioides phosphati]|uniref:Multidrug ABC transporter ATP-binding protein n=1 Tax=Nocardioides phosphati TaxID=1867775 RepID=A0ABQ2N463_9ACTN|nr:ABC transporter ATP-binding protein [Nocardioides phosphati]GGO83899.1 multidrug ABC transporter ATP-binding protein [Nocardioides phosphati]
MLLTLLRTQLRPYRPWLALVVLLQFLSTLAMLFLPHINANIIDQGVAKGDVGYIWRSGGLMLAVSLGQIVCSIIAVWFSSRTAMGFGRDVRRQVFHRVGSFSSREVAQFGAPSLITRGTNDVQQVQMLVLMGLTMLVSAPIMMAGGIIMAMREELGLSWLLAVTVPALLVTVGFIISRMVPGFKVMQGRIDVVNRILREQITGIRVVRAFVREPEEKARFAVANKDLTDVARSTGRWMGTMFPTVMLIMNVSIVGVYWFGAHRIDDGQMYIGSLTAFMSYLMQILMSVMMATFMLVQVPRAAVCAERIAEVLDTDASVRPPVAPIALEAPRGEVSFERVGFAYPGAGDPVLTDITFTARPGQTTAIVGSTGAGKSTLVDLVPRLYDATAGVVRVDGIDVRDLELETLWALTGIVPQKAFLFGGTIRSNLQVGKADATDEEMWAALRVAQGEDFVRALAEGLDAPVAQGGTNFSGGQRQRLAIARALVRRPKILILDDSFSALDVATDARLRRALPEVTAQSTVIVVAQRVSSIRDADQIVVLDDGRVVGLGTHESLLVDCPTYQEIVRSQLTEEEVA